MTPKEKENALGWMKNLLSMMKKSFPGSEVLSKAVHLSEQKVFYHGPVDIAIVDLYFVKRGEKVFCCHHCDKVLTKVFHIRQHVCFCHLNEVVRCTEGGCNRWSAVLSTGGHTPHSVHLAEQKMEEEEAARRLEEQEEEDRREEEEEEKEAAWQEKKARLQEEEAKRLEEEAKRLEEEERSVMEWESQ